MMALAAEVAFGSWLAAAGTYAVSRKRPIYGDLLALAGVLAGVLVLTSLWLILHRPPMRTLGETRWWYAVLVPALGIAIGWRFQTRSLAIPSCLLGALFAFINLRHPEYMDKTLMPALQSPWFVPHVVVYMLAYSALGLSSLLAGWNLLKSWRTKAPLQQSDSDVPHRMVMIGLPLLTCGLLFGALWAKEAWGHYWTWDPKETLAFLTWLVYLGYLHVHHRHAMKPAVSHWVLLVGFAALMLCWFGANELPSAKESVHTYSQSE